MSPLRWVSGVGGEVTARDGSTLVARTWAAPDGGYATVVLVPDIDEDAADWDRWGARFADQGIDLHAVSIRPRVGLSRGGWPAMLDDLSDALDRARTTSSGRPVVLHGHGVGATLALEHAVSDLPGADLLWLSNPAAGSAPGRVSGAIARLTGRARQDEVEREVWAATRRAFEGIEGLRVPLRLVFGADDLRTDPMPWFSLRDRIDVSWVIYNGVGHAIQRDADWVSRVRDIVGAIHVYCLRVAPELAPLPATTTVGERMPRKEARAAFKEFVATEEERVARLVAGVAVLGGPVPGCSREELARLGAWMIDALSEGPVSGPVPLWAADWRTCTGVWGRLSTETLWLIDGLAAWAARCYKALFPDLEWELDTYKSSVNYHRPVLGAMSPPFPARNVIQAAQKEPPDRDWLGAMWDYWSKAAAERAAAAAASSGPAVPVDELLDEVAVEPASHHGWDLTIWIPETADFILGERIFEGLGDRIGKLPGVVELAWEDREVMLVRVEPGVQADALRARVVGALDEARRERRRRPRARRG